MSKDVIFWPLLFVRVAKVLLGALENEISMKLPELCGLASLTHTAPLM